MEKLAIHEFILQYVKEIRSEAPRIGCEKLFVMCKAYFGELFRMGRDAFYRILQESGLMLRIRKRRTRTTDSSHGYCCYRNLIRGFVPERSNQLWVSDITYIRTLTGFCYLSLVTDAYSHKIVGWTLAPKMEYHYTQEALQMAIDGTKKPLKGLIHHSDRGFQYAYTFYTDLLHENGMRISMTENGDPLENAVAERVNGILKQEWLHFHSFKNIEHARSILEPAIAFYNTRRPHASINFLTPEQAENQEGVLRNRWKKKARKTPPDALPQRQLLSDSDLPIV
jgi:transposase InsO family protein